MSDIFQEVQEEYRRQQAEEFWAKYRVPIISAAVALVAVVAAYQGWTFWHAREVESSSREFQNATTMLDAPGQERAAAGEFAKLSNTGAGGYDFMAKFQEAAARAGAGDQKGAVEIYDRIADSGEGGALFADFARLRSAILLVDTAPLQAIKDRLEKIAASESPWRVEAEEFLGYAYWRAGNKAEALRLFDLIKNNPEAAEGTKRRATEMSALVQSGTTVADLKPPPAAPASPAGQPLLPDMPNFDVPPITTDPNAPAIPAPNAPTPTP